MFDYSFVGVILIRLFGILGVDGFGREVVPVAHEMMLSMYGRNSDEVASVSTTDHPPSESRGHRSAVHPRGPPFNPRRPVRSVRRSREVRHRLQSEPAATLFC